MTLPNPDKPAVSDTIETIVEDIQENLAYLDTNPSAYSVVYFELTAGNGSDYGYVSGIGFEPRAIIMFGISTYGALTVGYYGPSTGSDQFSLTRYRIITNNYLSSDRWQFNDNHISSIRNHFIVYGPNYYNYLDLTITQTYDDGFVYYYDETEYYQPETYYYVAICIK